MTPELPDIDRSRVGWLLTLALAVAFAFTELIHGEGVTPRVTAAESIGADPETGD